MYRRVFCVGIVGMSALLLLAGCSGPSSRNLPGVGPTGPTPVGSSTDFTISGTMWIYDGTGVAAAQSGTVFGWVERPGMARTTGAVNVSTQGRYQFIVPKGTEGVSVFGGPGYQPCAASQFRPRNTTLDVHRVVDKTQLGGHLPSALQAQTPTLSGVVFEITPNGRRPIPNAWVTLDGLEGLGVLVADTLSDAEGRYMLCGLPQSTLLAIVVGAEGFALKEVFYRELANRTTLDIEMLRIGLVASR